MTDPLFPYQIEGAEFLGQRARAGLFDAMGLGKTAQAIRALDNCGLTRGIIVCPASVRNVWPGEFRKWSRTPRRVLKGLTDQDLNLWLRERVDVLVMSYEGASKWHNELQRDLRDFTIFDEEHLIRKISSNRTRRALGSDASGAHGYARYSAHTWFLSGSPMANDPSDIWTFLRYCGGTKLSFKNFCTRYFIGSTGGFNTSYKPRRDTLPELRAILAEYSIRRTTDEVGLQLPPLWITTQEIEGSTAEINAMLSAHPGLDRAIRDAVEKGGINKLDETTGHITTLRRLVGEAKAPVFAKQLIDEIDGGLEKIVVFCCHKRPVEILCEVLTHHKVGYVKIDGSVSDNARVHAVEAFQSNPKVKVFSGNVVAAGTGLTLTAASQLVMLESDWQPANNAQALKRVHRIGQTQHTHVRFISLAKSIDEGVSKSVARKTRAITEVQGSEL
jgi:SWI/SNF-related matrix-associated actin-dependent regulator 1 of chromatin subfamily A